MMDEKGKNQTPDGIPILQVRDLEAEAAERREREKRDYEHEVEQRTRAFEAFLEQRKAKRDWFAIIFAAFAASFAGWAAYDAHKSLDHQTALVQVQEKSVSTQIEAMRRAEQPFVYPKVGDWRIVKSEYGQEIHVAYLPIVSGKTPALNIREVIRCDLYTQNRPPDFQNIPAPEYGVGFSFQPLNEPLLDIICGDENDPAIKSGPFGIHMYGQYQYEDMFGTTHHTPFCFSFGVFPPKKHGPMFGCPGKLTVNVD
jgi:hypothetical protein